MCREEKEDSLVDHTDATAGEATQDVLGCLTESKRARAHLNSPAGPSNLAFV